MGGGGTLWVVDTIGVTIGKRQVIRRHHLQQIIKFDIGDTAIERSRVESGVGTAAGGEEEEIG